MTLNIGKMSILPKLISGVNLIPIEIPRKEYFSVIGTGKVFLSKIQVLNEKENCYFLQYENFWFIKLC